MARDISEAIEDLKSSVDRSNGILRTVQGALAQAISTSEGLKGAMMKTGSFQSGKMYSILEKVTDLPGRFDKVLNNFGAFVMRGLGQNTKEFMKVLGKVSALGLDNTPFLMLTRSMNNTMGLSLEQQTKSLTMLLNLRDISEANPELLAGILEANSKVMAQHAGVYGPEFANNFQQVVSTMAAAMGGGGESLQGVIDAINPFLDASIKGMGLRSQIGLQSDISNLNSTQMMAFIREIPLALKRSGLFGTGGMASVRRAELGERFGVSKESWAIMDRLNRDLPTLAKLQTDLKRATAELIASEDLHSMMSTFMNKITNAFSSVLHPSIKALTENQTGLGENLHTLATQIAAWSAEKLLAVTTKTMEWLKDFVNSDKGMSGWQKLTEWWSKLMPTLGNIWALAQVAVLTLINFIAGGGIGAIIDTIVNTWDVVKEALPRILNDAWVNMGKVLGATLGFVLDQAINNMNYAFTFLVNNLDVLFAELMKGMLSIVAMIPGFKFAGDVWGKLFGTQTIGGAKRAFNTESEARVAERNIALGKNYRAMPSISKRIGEFQATKMTLEEEKARASLEQSSTVLESAVKNGFADAATKVTFSSKDAFMEKLWNWITENGGIKIAEDS